MERLFFIPRFRDHTVFAKQKSKYGRALVYVYPKSAGTVLVASCQTHILPAVILVTGHLPVLLGWIF